MRSFLSGWPLPECLAGTSAPRPSFSKLVSWFRVAGLALALAPFAGEAATYDIAVDDDFFSPQFFTVQPGDTVIWTNAGSSAHTVTADSGIFDSTTEQAFLPQGGSYSFTFTTEGEYSYYCFLHGQPNRQGEMWAVIRVADPANNVAPQTPTNVAPENAAGSQSTSLTLTASAFVDANPGELHTASQWVIRNVSTGAILPTNAVETVNRVSLPLSNLDFNTQYGWKVRYRDGFNAWSEFSTETFFTTVNPPPAGAGGLTATYAKYNRKKDEFTPVFTGLDPRIDFNWKLGKPHASTPANNFFIRWEGRILPEFSERYRFRVLADGGVRLWVNDELLIDDWVNANFALHRNNVIDLQAGVIATIKLEYYDTTGNASVNLRWSSLSQPVEVIPSNRLFQVLP